MVNFLKARGLKFDMRPSYRLSNDDVKIHLYPLENRVFKAPQNPDFGHFLNMGHFRDIFENTPTSTQIWQKPRQTGF